MGWFVAVALLGGFAQTAVAQREPDVWQIEDRPSLRIGLASGPEEYLFQSIADAVRLQGDLLAVADDGSKTIRVYGTDGQYRYSMGGRGAGPGDFYQINALWLTSAGELAAWDPTLLRITRFSQTGKYVETRRIFEPGTGTPQLFLGQLRDDEILLAASTAPRRREGVQSPDLWLLERYTISGAHRGLVGHVRGMWRYNRQPIPFSPMPWVATAQDTIYVVDGYEPSIDVRHRSGASSRALAVPFGRSATRADWADMERILRDSPASPFAGTFIDLLDRGLMPFDERMPAVAGLIIDEFGLLWVKPFEAPDDALWLRKDVVHPAPGGRWLVMDSRLGTTIAQVELPRTLVPLRIYDQSIVGKELDAWGIERVVVHALKRRPGGG